MNIRCLEEDTHLAGVHLSVIGVIEEVDEEAGEPAEAMMVELSIGAEAAEAAEEDFRAGADRLEARAVDADEEHGT